MQERSFHLNVQNRKMTELSSKIKDLRLRLSLISFQLTVLATSELTCIVTDTI